MFPHPPPPLTNAVSGVKEFLIPGLYTALSACVMSTMTGQGPCLDQMRLLSPPDLDLDLCVLFLLLHFWQRHKLASGPRPDTTRARGWSQESVFACSVTIECSLGFVCKGYHNHNPRLSPSHSSFNPENSNMQSWRQEGD